MVSYDNGSGIKDGEKQTTTMESVKKEEAIVPSPMKNQKLDDTEDDGGNSSDKDMSSPKLIPDVSPEPEWGFDSYDEREYIPDPGYREHFKNEADYEEFIQYRRKLLEGKGFVPDRFSCIVPLGNLASAKDLIQMCIDKFNNETGKTLEYVRTVKGNVRRGSKFTYYMTIMAREVPGGPLVEYQVKTQKYAGNWKPPVPIFCRPTPKPDN